MAGWDGLGGGAVGLDPNLDLLSLYLSKSVTPHHKILDEGTSPTPTPIMATPVVDTDCFCHHDNINECMQYLNQEVTFLGMPSLYEGGATSFDMVRVTNCLYELLQRHQRSARQREEAENRIHRMETDESHYRTTQGRLKATLEQTSRKLATVEERTRQFTNKNKLLTTKLKAEKDEVRRLQAESQYRYVQFKHDLNKKERETIRLKERLNQLLSDKCQEKKIGIEVSSLLQRTDGKRATWLKRHKQDEELQREVISNYEHHQKELMVENGALRQCLSACLSSLHKELATILCDKTTLVHFTDKCDSDGDSSGDSDAGPELTEAHFEMPCDTMRENLEKNMAGKCRMLKRHVRRISRIKDTGSSQSASTVLPTQNDEKHQKDLEGLHKQIARYREIIDQQDQLIQHSLVPAFSGPQPSPDALEDMEVLHAERCLFTQQKNHFDEERRAFTDAAIRLGRERQLFEKERSSYLAQQILQMTPFRLQESANLVPHDPDKSYLLAGTTAFSPAPNSKEPAYITPSTVELYRVLGITPREHRKKPASTFASPVLMVTNSPSPDPSSFSSPRSTRATPEHHRTRIFEHAQNIKMAVFNHQDMGELDVGESPRSPLC